MHTSASEATVTVTGAEAFADAAGTPSTTSSPTPSLPNTGAPITGVTLTGLGLALTGLLLWLAAARRRRA